jgi:hypothetical protein
MLSSIRKLLAVAVVLAALVPAGASAMVVREPAEAAGPSAPSAEATVQATDSGGFQWGDAGVGAAITLALVAGGVAVRTARRRAHGRGFAAG